MSTATSSLTPTSTETRWTASAKRYTAPHLRLRQVAALVAELQPASMFDIGCCSGFLRTLCPGIAYSGCDLVAPAEPVDFPFFRRNLNSETLPDEIIEQELIVCCGSLEYVEPLPKFLQTLHDRLRPGGHLIASYYNMNHISRIWAMLRGESFWVHPDWRGFHSPKIVRGMIEKTGLRVMRTVATQHAITRSPRIEETMDLPLSLPKARMWSELLSHQFIFVAEK